MDGRGEVGELTGNASGISPNGLARGNLRMSAERCQIEKPDGIVDDQVTECLDSQAPGCRNPAQRQRDMRRFVALPPEWHGSQVRRIRFD
jgi:hypothetical protein